MKILFVTPYYPSPQSPHITPFIKRLFDGLSAKCDIELYHFRSNKNPLHYLNSYFILNKKLKQNKYDIIHLNWGQSILVVPFFCKTKIVTTFRGSDVYGAINKQGRHNVLSLFMRLAAKLALYRSDFCIYVSDELRKFGNCDTPFKIIPSGVDLTLLPVQSKNELREKLGFKENEFIVLFVGDPECKRKRFWLAQELFKNELAVFNNVNLVNVWNKEPRVVFEFLKASDLLIQLSVQEGSPNIVKEAICSNLPIISTPVGDTPQQIRDLEGCFISKDFSKQEIVKSLIEAIRFNQKITNHDYSRRRLELSVESEVDSVMGVYHSLIKNLQ